MLVKDKNGTVQDGQIITPGQSIISKTGTITWRDSYENVTSFYLHIEEGYNARVYVDGEEVIPEDDATVKPVKVNSDLGKDATYNLDDIPGYEKVFYLTNAGKEAWSKNHTFEIKVEKTHDNLTIEKYYNNLNGNKFEEFTTKNKIKYGYELNKENLGLADDEYIVGANTVKFDGTPIKVVKRPNSFGTYQYGFTYVGDTADKHIKSVNAYWNNNKDNFVPVNLNETVTLNTNGLLFDERTINFVIEVEKGYELTGNLSNGKEIILDHVDSNESSEIYEMVFTRVGHHGYHKNPVHEMFSLQTKAIK